MNIVALRAESTPSDAIQQINNMAGGIVVDPRPDLDGEYVVKDIVSVQLLHTQGKDGPIWIASAVLSIEAVNHQPFSYNDMMRMGTLTGEV